MTAPDAAMSVKAAPLGPDEPRRLGSYDLLGKLGQGGMGTVYLGRGANGRLVAIKVIRADVAEHEEFRERFRLEAATARRVARVCTAEVLDAEPDGPWPYLVTEFIEGKTLARYVATTGPLTAANLEQLAVGVTAALTAIHSAGIVHRDLKPGNVILSPFGPRVIDFGIARALDAVTGLTGDMQTLGTPAFMSPEQITGQQITPAADIFAWGGVVTYAATGRYPFGEGNAQALLYRALHDEPDLSGLDEPLRSTVASSMQKEPLARPTAQTLMMRLLGQPLSSAPVDAEQQVTQVLRAWQLPASPPTPPGQQPVTSGTDPSQSPTNLSGGTGGRTPYATGGRGYDTVPPTQAVGGGQTAPPTGGGAPTRYAPGGQPGQSTPAPRKSRRALYIAAGALVAVVAIIGAVLALNGGSGGGGSGTPPGAFLPRSGDGLPLNTLVIAVQNGNVRVLDSLVVPDDGTAGTPADLVSGGAGVDRLLPVLTPDRRTVLYNTVVNGTISMRAIDAAGKETAVPLFKSGAAKDITISPDARLTVDPTGNYVVFKLVDDGKGHGAGLYVIALDGSSVRKIPGTENASDPNWSSSGILVYSDAGPTGGDGGSLVTVNPMDSHPTLTTIASGSLDADPAWSGDGKEIVFRRTSKADTGKHYDLYLLARGSTTPQRLTTDGAQNQDPSFAAGTVNRIVYTSGPGRQVLEIDASGGNRHPIAPGGGYYTPRWQSG